MKNNNLSNFYVKGGTLIGNFKPNTPSPRFKRANYLLMENFLLKDELKQLFRFTLEKERELQPSKVYIPETGIGKIDRDFRRSKVLNAPVEFRILFAGRIMNYFSQILERLEMKPFLVNHLDAQITATNDGEFFKPHTDNGCPRQKRRKISYVYYYYEEPKPYTGGELRLYEPQLRPKKTKADNFEPERAYKTIIPVQNSIIFFDSGTLHEVAKVNCPSKTFRDSRFTLNGWLHK